MKTFESLIFLVKMALKFRNLQMSNTDTDRISAILFKVMHISWRYT